MNIDLHAQFKKIYGSLGVSNSSHIALIERVYEFADHIWSPDVDHVFFTNHDLSHSRCILDRFAQMKDAFSWSEEESTVFALAAIIHDIGMQYNIWRSRVSPCRREALSQEAVREQHVSLMHDLILDLLDDKKGVTITGAGLSGIPHKSRHLLWNATQIACCHSGKEHLAKMFAPGDGTWKERPRSAESDAYRPRLLAVLLRLFDELDGSFRRLRDGQEDELFASGVDDVTRAHWLACWFVDSSLYTVKEDTRASTISVVIRVPCDVDADTKSDIINLVTQMREVKLNDEVSKLHALMQGVGEAHLFVAPTIKIDRDSPVSFFDPRTDKLSEHIRKALESQPKGSDIPSPTSGVASMDHAVAPRQPPAIGGALLDRLERWFYENRDKYHYELISGEHTDTYVHCRSLLQDTDLLRSISDALYELCNSKTHDHLIAIGTSAIPLGVFLSQRLGIPMSYAVHTNGYFYIEKNATIVKANRLLLVDDIVSSGRVASSIVEGLREKGLTVDSVTHLAVFRLGDRDVPNEPLVLLTRPEVRYYPSSGECDLCKNQLALKFERDIR